MADLIDRQSLMEAMREFAPIPFVPIINEFIAKQPTAKGDPALDLEEKGIYLIYTDSADDCCRIKGYIFGTEEDADKYTEELDKAEPVWDMWNYIKLDKLN